MVSRDVNARTEGTTFDKFEAYFASVLSKIELITMKKKEKKRKRIRALLTTSLIREMSAENKTKGYSMTNNLGGWTSLRWLA